MIYAYWEAEARKNKLEEKSNKKSERNKGTEKGESQKGVYSDGKNTTSKIQVNFLCCRWVKIKVCVCIDNGI